MRDHADDQHLRRASSSSKSLIIAALWLLGRAYLADACAVDWVVVVAYLAWIVIDGLRRSKGTDKVDGYFLANRSLPWWAVGLSVMATQMSAVTHRRHHRPGLRDRPALRAVLLRPAAGDGHPVADRRAVLHARARLHRLRVSRAALRRPQTRIAGQLPVPDGPRARRSASRWRRRRS